MTEKKHAVDAGEIVKRTFEDYRVVAQFAADVFGKSRAVTDLGAADFSRLKREITKRWGVIRTGNTIQRTRTIFKWAYDTELIDKPIRFGPDFTRPSQRILRKHRAANGERMFEAGEIRTALDAASKPMKAMILLAINCGFGNSDCGQLPLKALDLDAGWITYPRPKTGVDRRCPLWAETIEAIKNVLAMNRQPKDPENAGLVFYTERGLLWHKELHPSPVSKEFRTLLKKIDRHAAKAAVKAGRKTPTPIFVKGRGFYSLRHSHQTIAEEAGESPDFAAIARIMGHAERSDDMASRYRERISDERLLRITNHIRAWLFPPDETKTTEGGAE